MCIHVCACAHLHVFVCIGTCTENTHSLTNFQNNKFLCYSSLQFSIKTTHIFLSRCYPTAAGNEHERLWADIICWYQAALLFHFHKLEQKNKEYIYCFRLLSTCDVAWTVLKFKGTLFLFFSLLFHYVMIVNGIILTQWKSEWGWVSERVRLRMLKMIATVYVNRLKE